MKQMEKNPTVAIAGDWFTAHGKGVNLRVDYNEAFRKENKGAGNDGSVLGDFAGMDRERAVSALGSSASICISGGEKGKVLCKRITRNLAFCIVQYLFELRMEAMPLLS